MKEMATVKEINGDKVVLQKARLEACSACSVNCVGKASGEKMISITAIRNDILLKENDIVEIEIPNLSATKVAALLYGLPLIVFLFVLLIFSGLGLSEGIAALIAFGSMGIVYTLIAKYDRKNRAKLMPRIIRKVDTDDVFFVEIKE